MLAAVAYVVGLITGLIVYLVAEPHDRYARWHAIQSIGISLVVFAVTVLIAVAGALAGLEARVVGGLDAPLFGLWSLGGAWGTVGLVVLLVLALKAYQGTTVRVPVISGFADRHA